MISLLLKIIGMGVALRVTLKFTFGGLGGGLAHLSRRVTFVIALAEAVMREALLVIATLAPRMGHCG